MKTINNKSKKTISPKKAKFLKEFKAAFEEVKLAKQGKIKLKTAEELLNELSLHQKHPLKNIEKKLNAN
jgi:hypothetical protein